MTPTPPLSTAVADLDTPLMRTHLHHIRHCSAADLPDAHSTFFGFLSGEVVARSAAPAPAGWDVRPIMDPHCGEAFSVRGPDGSFATVRANGVDPTESVLFRYFNTNATTQAADYTVDDSELARKIMVFLGRATSGSMEPGADPLRDRLAERIALWRPAAPASDIAAAPEQQDHVAPPTRGTDSQHDASAEGEHLQDMVVGARYALRSIASGNADPMKTANEALAVLALLEDKFAAGSARQGGNTNDDSASPAEVSPPDGAMPEGCPVTSIITGVREFYLGLLARHLPPEAFDQARAEDATLVAYQGVTDRFLALVESVKLAAQPAEGSAQVAKAAPTHASWECMSQCPEHRATPEVAAPERSDTPAPKWTAHRTIFDGGEIRVDGKVIACPKYHDAHMIVLSYNEAIKAIATPTAASKALDAAPAGLDEAHKIMGDLLRVAESQICTHEETHRGGVIWEICDACGTKWADDRGGRPADVVTPAIKAARDWLDKPGAQDAAPDAGGAQPCG